MASLEFRNNGMEVWYDGIMVHSHFSNKVTLPSRVKESVRRNIDRKMPVYDQLKLIRKGGAGKDALDAYLDVEVSDIQDTLLDEANKHRTALSYERLVIRERQLDTLLNGLPLTVDQEVTDDQGNVTIEQVPNPLRDGYEPGHVMLDGLPWQIEEQLYDDQGNPTTTQMIDNPERTAAQIGHDTVVAAIAKAENNVGVMAIVGLRATEE